MRNLRRLFVVVILMTVAGVSASAQHYQQSRYYDSSTGRLNYGRNLFSDWGLEDTYVGFRLGPAFTSVSSDDPSLNGSSSKTGLNVGIVVGTSLTTEAPLFFETGLSYVEKGGKSNKSSGNSFTYSLDYLELPFTVKYIYSVDDHFTVQPFVGGYAALGVGGKIKNYQNREAYSSFGSSDDQFQRFDGGLRLGCGVGFDLFYAELGYDLGLSNIGHDIFDSSKNSALYLTFGVNF